MNCQKLTIENEQLPSFLGIKTCIPDTLFNRTIKIRRSSRAPWPCGIICHVLDWEVAGSNQAAISYSFGNKACRLENRCQRLKLDP